MTDENMQCSVCWEDFKLAEPVRKLVCDHMYHTQCIVPWLQLHGTCPICRKALADDSVIRIFPTYFNIFNQYYKDTWGHLGFSLPRSLTHTEIYLYICFFLI